MTPKELSRKLSDLKFDIDETGTRIRRYTLDPRLAIRSKTGAELKEAMDLGVQADNAWKRWNGLCGKYNLALGSRDPGMIQTTENEHQEVARDVDLLQRELIAHSSFKAG